MVKSNLWPVDTIYFLISESKVIKLACHSKRNLELQANVFITFTELHTDVNVIRHK